MSKDDQIINQWNGSSSDLKFIKDNIVEKFITKDDPYDKRVGVNSQANINRDSSEEYNSSKNINVEKNYDVSDSQIKNKSSNKNKSNEEITVKLGQIKEQLEKNYLFKQKLEYLVIFLSNTHYKGVIDAKKKLLELQKEKINYQSEKIFYENKTNELLQEKEEKDLIIKNLKSAIEDLKKIKINSNCRKMDANKRRSLDGDQIKSNSIYRNFPNGELKTNYDITISENFKRIMLTSSEKKQNYLYNDLLLRNNNDLVYSSSHKKTQSCMSSINRMNKKKNKNLYIYNGNMQAFQHKRNTSKNRNNFTKMKKQINSILFVSDNRVSRLAHSTDFNYNITNNDDQKKIRKKFFTKNFQNKLNPNEKTRSTTNSKVSSQKNKHNSDVGHVKFKNEKVPIVQASLESPFNNLESKEINSPTVNKAEYINICKIRSSVDVTSFNHYFKEEFDEASKNKKYQAKKEQSKAKIFQKSEIINKNVMDAPKSVFIDLNAQYNFDIDDKELFNEKFKGSIKQTKTKLTNTLSHENLNNLFEKDKYHTINLNDDLIHKRKNTVNSHNEEMNKNILGKFYGLEEATGSKFKYYKEQSDCYRKVTQKKNLSDVNEISKLKVNVHDKNNLFIREKEKYPLNTKSKIIQDKIFGTQYKNSSKIKSYKGLKYQSLISDIKRNTINNKPCEQMLLDEENIHFNTKYFSPDKTEKEILSKNQEKNNVYRANSDLLNYKKEVQNYLENFSCSTTNIINKIQKKKYKYKNESRSLSNHAKMEFLKRSPPFKINSIEQKEELNKDSDKLMTLKDNALGIKDEMKEIINVEKVEIGLFENKEYNFKRLNHDIGQVSPIYMINVNNLNPNVNEINSKSKENFFKKISLNFADDKDKSNVSLVVSSVTNINDVFLNLSEVDLIQNVIKQDEFVDTFDNECKNDCEKFCDDKNNFFNDISKISRNDFIYNEINLNNKNQ